MWEKDHTPTGCLAVLRKGLLYPACEKAINENKDSAPGIISPNCVLGKRLLKPIFLIEVHDDKLQKNASVNFGSKIIIIVILSYALRSEFSI